MILLRLLPEKSSNLKEVLNAELRNCTESKSINLSYGKILPLTEHTYDFIISPNLLNGELYLLSAFEGLIIINSQFFSPKIYENNLNLRLKGRTLQIGSPLIKDAITVTGTTYKLDSKDEIVRAIIPLPFKDSVFDNVVISEVMDYDVVREAYRVTKRGGKGMIIVPQNNAVDALKVLSIKFRIISASEVNKYWIIEGVKVR
ncbi:hypothetical protein [Sulfolobus acidocaldarius]|uniref:Uncharacterized protein n=3 Tax=Sulfolobus acidocaldarius TaxID=2285 RepID=A0A0U3FE34_9CREN|nr:hypothetical protein [Sulfolobus acidocaldarius]AGE71141.1 hypothetical protein SacN8_05880 [Sulfolobus acidocaldarius N8]AGE73411.1 hypothetical protein SacRon12I_05875 [Sulfolobus acidocaldarius Ron12/I]ALU28587.1 hypothetical protein ATY89_00470 [Sulfolobus acidocaldarius]ALU31300.1 hypothetical protein ATZ20_03515 [Sulfolobus acidocaldarius]WCM35075.1 hypothetical protein GO597_06895 [Sulfolobus acidocaldarius DSM 639]